MYDNKIDGQSIRGELQYVCVFKNQTAIDKKKEEVDTAVTAVANHAYSKVVLIRLDAKRLQYLIRGKPLKEHVFSQAGNGCSRLGQDVSQCMAMVFAHSANDLPGNDGAGDTCLGRRLGRGAWCRPRDAFALAHAGADLLGGRDTGTGLHGW